MTHHWRTTPKSPPTVSKGILSMRYACSAAQLNPRIGFSASRDHRGMFVLVWLINWAALITFGQACVGRCDTHCLTNVPLFEWTNQESLLQLSRCTFNPEAMCFQVRVGDRWFNHSWESFACLEGLIGIRKQRTCSERMIPNKTF